jgi:hypothetical protein
MSLAKPTLPESKSPSRRALLAGALGGVGVLAASAIGRVSPARAEGETIVVGGEYDTATSLTRIRNQANSANVFQAESAGSGIAVHGSSSMFIGVRGSSSSHIGVAGSSGSSIGVHGSSSSHIGVQAQSNSTDKPAAASQSNGNSTGLLGHSGTGLLPAAKAKTGVYGEATQDNASRGVWGHSTAGQGVRGQATSGVGLFGTASSGFALRANGRIKADKVSGVATIPAGSTGVAISPGVNVTSGSFVLLTPKANIGSRALWFTTNTTNNTITIRMSSSRSSGTKVAWLLLG